MNMRKVQEEVALRIQNGSLTSWYHIEKCRESFCPLLTLILTFKWVKVSISFNFVFFMIGDDPSRSELIGPGLAVGVDLVRLLYLPFHIFTSIYKKY